MYKRKQIVNQAISVDVTENSPFCSTARIARPFSYFAKGGVDLDATDRVGPPGYSDDAESIASGDIDMATDARISRLDILDEASRQYQDRETKRAASKLTGESVPEK